MSEKNAPLKVINRLIIITLLVIPLLSLLYSLMFFKVILFAIEGIFFLILLSFAFIITSMLSFDTFPLSMIKAYFILNTLNLLLVLFLTPKSAELYILIGIVVSLLTLIYLKLTEPAVESAAYKTTKTGTKRRAKKVAKRVFIGSATSKRVHSASCKSVKRIMPKNRVVFSSLAKAKRNGFTLHSCLKK